MYNQVLLRQGGEPVQFVGDWIQPLLAVGALGALTLIVALFVGRWIDAQSNSVVDEPRKGRRERPPRK